MIIPPMAEMFQNLNSSISHFLLVSNWKEQDRAEQRKHRVYKENAKKFKNNLSLLRTMRYNTDIDL